MLYITQACYRDVFVLFQEYCKDRGGHLVKINDQDEIDHFGKLFPSSGNIRISNMCLWIG